MNDASLDVLCSSVHHLLLRSVSDLPPEAWWLPGIALAVLFVAAIIDGLFAVVPDLLIAFGFVGVFTAQVFFVSWPFALQHVISGLLVALCLWAVNEAWYKIYKSDAIGLGDAKWSALAVTAFGFLIVVFAWGAGACAAVTWLAFTKLYQHKVTRVYFTPFLFAGLLIAIYCVRLRQLPNS